MSWDSVFFNSELGRYKAYIDNELMRLLPSDGQDKAVRSCDPCAAGVCAGAGFDALGASAGLGGGGVVGGFPARADGGELARAMRYVCEGGGKRVRAALALAVCETLGAPIDEAAPIACAIELIHAYSLAHDDMPCMDDDDMRRGRPSAHVAFGEGMAMLAGDALQTLAFEILALDAQKRAESQAAAGQVVAGRSQDAAGTAVAGRSLSMAGMPAGGAVRGSALGAARAAALIAGASGAAGMAGGQSADILCLASSLEELRCVHALKTGRLIHASAVAPAMLLGASEDVLGALSEYALEAGIAFQIGDDLLDSLGDEAATGKRGGRDAELGKPTYVAFLGDKGARDELERACARAKAALRRLPSPGGAARFLETLADFILHRDR